MFDLSLGMFHDPMVFRVLQMVDIHLNINAV